LLRFARNDSWSFASQVHNLARSNEQVTNLVYALAGVNYAAAMDKQKDSFLIHCLT
jgi:hypothetical protein